MSDLDLVAVTSKPLWGQALEQVVRIHGELDAGLALGMGLGCQYVSVDRLLDVTVEHPTWTHGEKFDRVVSRVTRAELVLHGYPVLGPPPPEMLPTVTPDEVGAAAQAELAGYWSYAARRPQMFLRLPVMVDLGLTSMARARYAIATGELLTKTAAIERARGPAWLRADLRTRRRGGSVKSPRWRAAYIAWRDVRRTTSSPTRPGPA
ncbi:MAG: hypothetical protein ABI355_12445 [Solirubrobacteraceae bacterium]